jgi:hypothetical protein
MTANDPRYHRQAHAELASEGVQALSGLVPLAALFHACLSSATNLVRVRSGEFGVQAALLVDVLRHRLEVLWVDAGRVPAEMVDLEIVGEGSDEGLVVEAARLYESPTYGVPYLPIALSASASQPDPAGRLVAAVAQLVTGLQRLGGSALCVVARDVPHRYAADSSLAAVRFRGDGGSLPAAALAETERDVLRHVPIFASVSDGAL